MINCRICSKKTIEIHDFGKMPLANGFIKKEDFHREYFFNLAIVFCTDCLMLQLEDQPNPEIMFHDEYPFFTGSSQKMVEHFSKLSQFILSNINQNDPFIVEIGSNDGTHLSNFAKKNIRHLGIEPSKNVATKAQECGVATINEFFTKDLATQIVSKYGQAHVITTTNVLCHIPDINGFIQACDTLLTPDGLVIFEDPYLGDILPKTAYDQIYDEHVYFFSLLSVQKLFARFGFELIDANPQWTHGGSMRYTLCRKGIREPASSISELLQHEKNLGLDQLITYQSFSIQIQESRDKLRQLVHRAKSEGKIIAGYAATSKSTTVINYCGLTPADISFICDTTPLKQGKFSPGSHIPVTNMEQFYAIKPDYAILFAWNHAEEILEKEEDYLTSGGKFIYFVPEVKLCP